MKLSEIKSQLPQLSQLTFFLPDGTSVPAHFHITEVGQVTKRFIDCGGTLRDEKSINFQLWEDGDYDHRLGAKKNCWISFSFLKKFLDSRTWKWR